MNVFRLETCRMRKWNSMVRQQSVCSQPHPFSDGKPLQRHGLRETVTKDIRDRRSFLSWPMRVMTETAYTLCAWTADYQSGAMIHATSPPGLNWVGLGSGSIIRQNDKFNPSVDGSHSRRFGLREDSVQIGINTVTVASGRRTRDRNCARARGRPKSAHA